MPPSHLASRAVLAVLLVAVVTALILTNLDPTTWDRFNQEAQAVWSALRTAVQGTTA